MHGRHTEEGYALDASERLDGHFLFLIEQRPATSCSEANATMRVAQAVTEAEYIQALLEIRRLVAAEPDRGTPEGERLEALTSLAETFEADLCLSDLADAEAR